MACTQQHQTSIRTTQGYVQLKINRFPCPCLEGIQGDRGIAPLILYLGTRWGLVGFISNTNNYINLADSLPTFK